MIRSFICALALSAAVVATPAAAATFTGPRVGVTAGVAGEKIFSTDVATYGINAGYDAAFGKVIVGGQVEYQDGFKSYVPRDLSATLRLGGKVSNNALLYATGGYTNLRTHGLTADGYRVGVGAEMAFSKNVSVSVEQRYSNYGHSADVFQTVAGLNFRF